MSVLLSSATTPHSGAVACRWIEPLTMNRAAPRRAGAARSTIQTLVEPVWFHAQ
jgi:hypothetical protein